MREIQVSLDRLRRHYNASFRQCDEVSLRDLAHALRTWVDMQERVHQFLEAAASPPHFETVELTDELEKEIKSRDFLFLHLPHGVTTSSPMIFEMPSTGPDLTINVRVNVPAAHKPASTTIGDVLFVFGPNASVPTDFAALPRKALLFSQWLNAPAVSMRYTNLDLKQQIRLNINREILIRRVANLLVLLCQLHVREQIS